MIKNNPMKTKGWKPLQKGDLIDIVAPGWVCSDDELQGAVRFLETQGFRARWDKNIFQERLKFANEHGERFSQLKAALTAKDSQAVWCIRGGYGSIHLLPKLLKVKAPQTPKLFIGISDITSLHIFLNQKWKWPTLHASLLDRIGAGKVEKKRLTELIKLCKGETREIEFRGLKAMNREAKTKGSLSAPIIGGNLTVMQSSLGTPSSIQTKGAFLFIEDLGERGYRIDRILEQLNQAGQLKGIKALLIGDFLGGYERDGQSLVLPVLNEWAERLKVPVISNLPCGHGEVQRPLAFATPAKLQLGSRPSLIVQSGAKL